MSCKETSSPIIYGMPPQYAFFREENPNFPPYSLSFNIFTSSPMSWKKSLDSFLQYIHPWLHIFRLPEHLCHATQQPWVPSDLIEEKNVYLYHFPCPAPLMCICLASPCLLPRRITNIADSTNHHLRGKKPKKQTLFWPSTCRIMYVSSWIGQRLTLNNCETIDYYECWLGTSLFFCRDVVFLPPPWLLTKDRDGIAFA